jgi:SAM-dependent methyltransferase
VFLMTQEALGFYERLAPYYREYAGRREVYIRAVDAFILGQIPGGSRSLLDVGAGDGVRGMAIARAAGCQRIVLCEPSPAMAAACQRLQPSEVWNLPAEKLPGSQDPFDVILSLWNVLGHVGTREKRIEALRKMKQLLAPGGTLFFDINNRYNAPAYGWREVIKRLVIDTLKPDERRGDSVFELHIAGQTIPGSGHLFTPREIAGIVKESGLSVKSRYSVNYKNGTFSKSTLLGQLFYEVH